MSRTVFLLRPFIAANETPGIAEDIQGEQQEVTEDDLKDKASFERRKAEIQRDFRDSFQGIRKKDKKPYDKWPGTLTATEVVKFMKQRIIVRKVTAPVIIKGERVTREIARTRMLIRGKVAHRWRDSKTGRFVKVAATDGQTLRGI